MVLFVVRYFMAHGIKLNCINQCNKDSSSIYIYGFCVSINLNYQECFIQIKIDIFIAILFFIIKINFSTIYFRLIYVWLHYPLDCSFDVLKLILSKNMIECKGQKPVNHLKFTIKCHQISMFSYQKSDVYMCIRLFVWLSVYLRNHDPEKFNIVTMISRHILIFCRQNCS